MITFAIHGYEGVDPAAEFGPLQAEFEKRGVRCLIVRSARTKTKTPNLDRAKVMVEALRGVEGEVALIGISNQGLFMPLVAEARPIKRIVFINGAIPQPGKSFWETARKERAFASVISWLLAWVAPGMHEVYAPEDLPKVEYVYVCAEHDESIRPEWEQRAARQYLHVEPVVVAGAGHSNIVMNHISEVVDAALLQPQKQQAEARARPERRRKPNAGLSFVISHFAPLIAYFAVRRHVSSDTAALAIAWFIPLAWTLGSSVWSRRLEVMGVVGIAGYGIALSVSIFFGVGALPLKLHHAAGAVIFGLACLISYAARWPILPRLVGGITRAAGVNAPAWVAADPGSRTGKIVRSLTVVVGVACLASAAVQTVLALTLSTGEFLIAKTALHLVEVIGVVSGVLLYSKMSR
jgi:hypothetical protein